MHEAETLSSIIVDISALLTRMEQELQSGPDFNTAHGYVVAARIKLERYAYVVHHLAPKHHATLH